MTTAELQYIISVQDRDLKNLKKELRDTNKTLGDTSASSKYSGGLKSVGKFAKVAALGVGVVGGGLAWALKSCVEAAMEHEKVMAQTKAVIKSTGKAANVNAKQVEAMADSLQAKVGVDGEAIQSGQNMLLTFTNVRNEVGKGNKIFDQATNTLVDMSVALGTDMSKQAIQLGKALNDPIKGVSALSRVGVTFTEGQKATIKSMVEMGNTAGAQKLILAELNKEFGGSAEAAGNTLPGQMAKAKLAFGELQENIGQKLIPVLTRLLVWFNEHWPQISAVIDRTCKIIAGIFTNVLIPAFNGVMAVAKPIVAWFRENWPQISAIVRTAMETIRTIITTISNQIKSFWNTWGATITAVVRGIFNGIKIYIETVLGVIRGIIKVITGLIRGDWGLVWEGLKQTISSVFTGIINMIRNMAQTVVSAAGAFGRAIFNGIVGALTGLGERLWRLIVAPINGIIRKINGFKLPGFNVDIPFLGNVSMGSVDPIPHIPELAKGGIVKRPTLALVGEAGPEAVVPLNRRGGMGTNIVNLTVEGSVTSEADLVKTIIDGLRETQKRNGTLGIA